MDKVNIWSKFTQLSNVPNNPHDLHQYFLSKSDFLMPSFCLNSKNIEILDNPQQFYSTLINKIRNCQFSITLSSLYIGDDDFSKKLITTIETQLKLHPSLTVKILVDKNRSIRTLPKDSALKSYASSYENYTMNMMMKLACKYDDRFNLFLCNGSNLKPQTQQQLTSYSFINYIGEINSVHHIKLFLFDNNIMISGANLSSDYFTKRYDRYIVIKNEPDIAAFLNEFMDIYSQYSIKITPYKDEKNKKSYITMETEINALLKSYQPHNKNLSVQLSSATKTNNGIVTSSNNDTFMSVYLTLPKLSLYMDKLIIDTLCNLPNTYTKSIIDIVMMTAYLNLTKDNISHIKTIKPPYHFTIVTSHLTNNAFFKDNTLKKWIATFYSLQMEQYFQSETSIDDCIKLLEFVSKNESFHGKGIWVFDAIQQPSIKYDSLLLHINGSSNYGYRSQFRDCELNFMFSTSSSSFKNQLCKDYERIFNCCIKSNRALLQQRHLYIPKLLRWMLPLAKFFL